MFEKIVFYDSFHTEINETKFELDFDRSNVEKLQTKTRGWINSGYKKSCEHLRFKHSRDELQSETLLLDSRKNVGDFYHFIYLSKPRCCSIAIYK